LRKQQSTTTIKSVYKRQVFIYLKLRFPTQGFLTRCGTARHGKNCRTHKKEEVFPNVRWRRGAARHGDGTVRRGFLNRFWSDFFLSLPRGK
jgi:hypothetical protein